MQIQFIPVNRENRHATCGLSVASHQKKMIETVEECLLEADEIACWNPVLIEINGEPVGFAMYGLWIDEGSAGRVWLDRFLIDEKHQGKGYATTMLTQLIEKIDDEYNKDELFLSVYLDNVIAIELYKKLGFEFNGEEDINKELVMVRKKQVSK